MARYLHKPQIISFLKKELSEYNLIVPHERTLARWAAKPSETGIKKSRSGRLDLDSVIDYVISADIQRRLRDANIKQKKEVCLFDRDALTPGRLSAVISRILPDVRRIINDDLYAMPLYDRNALRSSLDDLVHLYNELDYDKQCDQSYYHTIRQRMKSCA